MQHDSIGDGGCDYELSGGADDDMDDTDGDGDGIVGVQLFELPSLDWHS